MFCRKTGIVGTGGNCLAFMRPFLFYFMTKFRGSPFLQIHKQKFELFVICFYKCSDLYISK